MKQLRAIQNTVLPKRARSIDGFVDILEKEGTTLVRAEPKSRILATQWVPFKGNIRRDHYTRYVAMTEGDRRVIYDQLHAVTSPVVPCSEFYPKTHQGLTQIKQSLPDVDVTFISPKYD